MMRPESWKQANIKNSILLKRVLLSVLLFTALVILSACGGAAPEEPAATEAPAEPEQPAAPAATEAPAEPEQPSEQYPVQYGQDTRTELFQHPDTTLKEMAASVAIFVHKNQVRPSGDTVTLDAHTLDEMSQLGWLVNGANLPMCADELFSSQPAPGFCTGFLVAADILVTAGHCVQKTACADTSVVFGFQMASGSSLAEISKEDVFACGEVIRQVLPTPDNGYLDYALIKLDRPTGRAGLSYNSRDSLAAQDQVAVLGYPSGLPQKIASNSFVLSNETGSPFFVANLDTFGSNSGSPVINMDTYHVEGILVRGTTDYVLSSDGSCVQVNRCPEGGGARCEGENATKMAMLAADIEQSASGKPGGLNCVPGMLLVLALVALARFSKAP